MEHLYNLVYEVLDMLASKRWVVSACMSLAHSLSYCFSRLEQAGSSINDQGLDKDAPMVDDRVIEVCVYGMRYV